MVNIVALSLCLLNTQKLHTRNWTKTTSGKQIWPSHIQTSALEMTDEQTSFLFSTAAPPFALARGYAEQWTGTCQLELFSPPFLAELTLKSIFFRSQTPQWLKLQQIRGQVRNTLHICSKILIIPSLFYSFVPALSKSYAQYWAKVQLRCSTCKYCTSFGHIKVTWCN